MRSPIQFIVYVQVKSVCVCLQDTVGVKGNGEVGRCCQERCDEVESFFKKRIEFPKAESIFK